MKPTHLVDSSESGFLGELGLSFDAASEGVGEDGRVISSRFEGLRSARGCENNCARAGLEARVDRYVDGNTWDDESGGD